MTSPAPTITVLISRKVYLGHYETVDVFATLKDMTAETTEQDMKRLLKTGDLAWDVIAEHLEDEARIVKARFKSKRDKV